MNQRLVATAALWILIQAFVLSGPPLFCSIISSMSARPNVNLYSVFWLCLYVLSREAPSRSSTLSEPTHTEVKVTENGLLNGDFLTLAPPASASPHLSSKHSLSSSSPLSRELSEFGFQTSQVRTEKTKIIFLTSVFTGFPFYVMFPSFVMFEWSACYALQLNGEDSIPGKGLSKSMRPPFFSFFPAAKKEIGQGSSNNCNGEVGEKVDLSLKL